MPFQYQFNAEEHIDDGVAEPFDDAPAQQFDDGSGKPCLEKDDHPAWYGVLQHRLPSNEHNISYHKWPLAYDGARPPFLDMLTER